MIFNNLLKAVFVIAISTQALANTTYLQCSAVLNKSSMLNSLQSDLNSFFDSNRNEITRENYKPLNPVLSRENLIKLIDEIINDSSLLENIAKNSYVHSLGFSKIQILDDWNNRGYDLRLHIWWPNEAAARGAPTSEGKHVHQWNFASRLLVGSFESHDYNIRPPLFHARNSTTSLYPIYSGTFGNTFILTNFCYRFVSTVEDLCNNCILELLSVSLISHS